MSNPWFRMYHEFAVDPKVQMLSEVDQRRYIMVLCLRCCNGDVTLQDVAVAFQLRISNDEWMQTKQVLMAANLIDEDGQPVAWDKRQYTSDSSAERVRRHREKKKRPCNVTVTPPDTDADTETDTDIEPKPSGEKFKKPTVEEISQYCNTRKNGIDPEEFYNFYESKGWMVGKNKMKKWKACVITWEKNPKNNGKKKTDPMMDRIRNLTGGQNNVAQESDRGRVISITDGTSPVLPE